MTTAIMERERVHEYAKDDVIRILADNDMTLEDCNYLAAIRIPTGVSEVLGVATALTLPTVSLRLYYISEGPTGYYHALGKQRLVFLNDNDMADYDLVSELHSNKAADAYLALTAPWEAGRDVPFEQLKEWYRDETYPDHFKEDA